MVVARIAKSTSLALRYSESYSMPFLLRLLAPDPTVKRFRALIVGRANAGKTSILKSICDSKDEPRIYNAEGEEVRRLLLAFPVTLLEVLVDD